MCSPDKMDLEKDVKSCFAGTPVKPFVPEEVKDTFTADQAIQCDKKAADAGCIAFVKQSKVLMPKVKD